MRLATAAGQLLQQEAGRAVLRTTWRPTAHEAQLEYVSGALESPLRLGADYLVAMMPSSAGQVAREAATCA